MLNNLSCPIVWVLCLVVIIYAIIVRQDGVAVLVGNQVAAACRRSVVLNNLSCPDCMGAVFGRDNLRDNRAVR